MSFIFLTTVFICFLVIAVYGGRLIYEAESEALRDTAVSELKDDKKTVGVFFADCSRDLLFLRNLPGISESVAEGPLTSRSQAARQVITTFLDNHPYYSNVRIFDSAGRERLGLKVRQDLREEASSYLLWQGGTPEVSGTAKGEEDRIKAFLSGFRGGDVIPVISLLTRISAPGGGARGVLIMDISVPQLLMQLSKNTYLMGDGETMTTLGEDGRVLKKTAYALPSGEGMRKLSDTENIFYSAVEYVPGQTMGMVKVFSYSSFKRSLARIEITSVSIFASFFAFVFAFSFYNTKNFRRMTAAQKAIIYSLANLSEWRDPETGSHLERTRNFTVLLARTLQKRQKYGRLITERFIEDLYDSVPLHDIGKVGIRDDILLKAARLSREEFESMKSHVLIGKEVIHDIIARFDMPSSFLIMSRNICHYHHEKYNGLGYPEGLKGDAIPLEARIFAVCDVYDALRAKRPYKEALSHEETLEIIALDRGRQFDPEILDALAECSGEFCEIFESYKLFDATYGKLMNLRSRDALKVAWSDDLSVGNAKIDAQHREFIERINRLFAATLKGEAKGETLRAIDFLYSYAVHHFRTEEQMMKDLFYPAYEPHKLQHDMFFRNLRIIKHDIETGGLSSKVVLQINTKVVNWLIEHILKEDKMIGMPRSHRMRPSRGHEAQDG